MIGILNELNKFNNDITQLQETIELSGGSRQVNTLYIVEMGGDTRGADVLSKLAVAHGGTFRSR